MNGQWTACIAGLAYAISVYWGLGGTWLLDTVGGCPGPAGAGGYAGVLLAVWAATALKVIAAVLPLLGVRARRAPKDPQANGRRGRSSPVPFHDFAAANGSNAAQIRP